MKLVPLPNRLRDVLDTYYQTSAFARQNFIKFSRDFTTNAVKEKAASLGYTVVVSDGKNAGQFLFQRPNKTLKVTRQTFPMAELRA